MARKQTPEERERSQRARFERRVKDFWSRVERRSDVECWPWTGGKDELGYGRGRLTVSGVMNRLAHRVMYVLVYGPIPEGFVVDHICHDPKTCPGGSTCPHRLCQNPAHLKAVKPRENNDRTRRSRNVPTHCPVGHEYNEKNARIYRGSYVCRVCDRERGQHGRRESEKR